MSTNTPVYLSQIPTMQLYFDARKQTEGIGNQQSDS